MSWWQRVGGWLREDWRDAELERLQRRITQAAGQQLVHEDRLRSITASLEDAHREVARLSAEKHARDTVINAAIETLGSLHP